MFNWLSAHHIGGQSNTVIHTAAAAATVKGKINSYQNFE